MDTQMILSNLSQEFPSYLSPLFSITFLARFVQLLLIAGLGYLSLLLLQTLFRLYRMFKGSYVFLEVKPTYKAQQSAFSTKQLFTILHSLDRPASILERLVGIKQTISCELVSTKESGIRYILRVASGDMSLIKKSLLGYLPGIEVNEIGDYFKTKLDEKGFLSLRQLKLKRSFIFPLQEQSQLIDYDPIAYVTAHMTKLAHNEMISLHFICTPVLKHTHNSVYSHIQSLKQKMLSDQDISSDLYKGFLHNVFFVLTKVFGSGKQKRIHELSISKKELYQSIDNKISEPLFEVTMRLFVLVENKQSAVSRIKGLKSSFDTFSTSYQSLQIQRSFLSLINSHIINRARYFILRSRQLSLKANIILSVSELSSLYHLPYTSTTKTEDLINVKSPMLPSPLPLKSSSNHLDMVFAHNTYGETTVPIGLTLEERRRHMYIIGATGTGKTTALLHMIHHDLLKGSGVAIIDPHGDLIQKLLGVIPEERIKDVVYFNPYDIEKPVGLNMLELQQGLNEVETQREKDLIASSMISIFQKLYPLRYSGPRMEHILRNAVLTALELEKPTLLTVYRLLTNKDFRKKTVASLPKGVLKDFWNDEFGKLGSFQKAEQISPITNKLGRFLTTSMTRNILTQEESKLNFADIMNTKKILLCDLSKGKIGEDTSSFLGSLIVAKIQLAALKRVDIPQDRRTDFFLYIDEFQNFATPSFAQILSEARKYRLNTILAHQTISQIEDKDLFKVILANVGSVISFRTSNPSDEVMILPLFAPQVEKHEISNLPSYHFYMKINAIEPQNAFTGAIDDFAIEEKGAISQSVIKSSQELYGSITKKVQKPNENLKVQKPVLDIDNSKPGRIKI